MKTEWVHKKLGDLGYSYSGLSGKTIDDFGEGKPFIPYMNIFSNGEIDPDKLEYVRIADNEHQNKVEQGDWFFTTSSETPEEVGMTSVLVDNIGEAYLNSFCFGFRLYNKQEFDPKFASYLFRSEELRKKISLFAQGSTRYNLPKQQMFEKLFISYPASLSAQRRIAAILASADKVIAATQKTIAKYKQIKQGMMEELFNEQCTMNNVQWKKVRFGEFFDMLPTNTLSRDKLNNQQGEYQNIHYGDVLIKYPFCLDCNNAEIPYINDDVKFNMAEVRDGDVIFADTAEDDTVGKCVEVLNVGDRKIVSGLHTYFCRPRHKMALGYLGYYLNSNHFHNQLLPYIAGSKVSSVNRTSIARTFISYPVDLVEQRRIAAILSGIDAKIAAEEKVLEKYEKVKKGLMERLLNEQ